MILLKEMRDIGILSPLALGAVHAEESHADEAARRED